MVSNMKHLHQRMQEDFELQAKQIEFKHFQTLSLTPKVIWASMRENLASVFANNKGTVACSSNPKKAFVASMYVS